MERSLAEKKVLKNIVIEIKPIIRENKGGFFKKGHDGEFMFTGCNKTYMLPFVMGTRSYAKIFKDNEEQEAFEELLDLPKGTLGIYKRDSAYWTKYQIEISKEGKTLDLSIPSHALEHRVLLANKKRISPDWDSKTKPGYEFAMVDETKLESDFLKLAEKSENAMELFMKIRKNNKKMFNVLRILGKNPSVESASNTGWLKSELQKIIDQKEKIKGGNIPNIDDFIRVAEDPNFDMKALVYDAMNIGEIVLKGSNFRHAESDEFIGKSLSAAADWLSDIKNQEHKLLIEQRLKLNK